MSYWPGDTTGDNLEFALKYDGTNPEILLSLFDVIPEEEISEWIISKPTGKYARRIWYLYEFLTGQKPPLSDLKQGNYVELLESDQYFTIKPGQRIQRQRIIDNLLGGRLFCPIIRRSKKLAAMEAIDLHQHCEEVVTPYPQELLRRALAYLYTKETKSSFEIEHITPSTSRTEKFVDLLKMAEHRDYCGKLLLIDIQNRIVDSRFHETDYRKNQNYVGQTISFPKQLIHYVSPKPEDLPNLMEGLLSAHQRMKAGAIPAVIHVAVISYGFVFLHPFADGNGRIHRFLIHNILSLRGATPAGLMFPVSAAMLKNPTSYDYSLEVFSRPLMRLIDYDLDDLGQMTVHGETGHFYRAIDMTEQAEALYDFVMLTLEKELVDELEFLVSYDKTRKLIQNVVDMPDTRIDLFIRFCLQNNGRLSAKKRESHFAFLTGDELASLEEVVRIEMGPSST